MCLFPLKHIVAHASNPSTSEAKPACLTEWDPISKNKKNKDPKTAPSPIFPPWDWCGKAERNSEWRAPLPTLSTRHSFDYIISQCSTNYVHNSPWHSCGIWYKLFSRNLNIHSLTGSLKQVWELGKWSLSSSFSAYFSGSLVMTCSVQDQDRNPTLAKTRPCFLFCPWRPWVRPGATEQLPSHC